VDKHSGQNKMTLVEKEGVWSVFFWIENENENENENKNKK
jgi:hypothetical protein